MTILQKKLIRCIYVIWLLAIVVLPTLAWAETDSFQQELNANKITAECSQTVMPTPKPGDKVDPASYKWSPEKTQALSKCLTDHGITPDPQFFSGDMRQPEGAPADPKPEVPSVPVAAPSMPPAGGVAAPATPAAPVPAMPPPAVAAPEAPTLYNGSGSTNGPRPLWVPQSQ
jgi:hypothetical protein